MKAFDKWSTIQTTHLGEYWMLSADISKFAEILPICSQGRELLEYVPPFSCPLNKQHWIIFSLSLMTIFYFESILTAFIFCSSTVFWKFTCHFLCRTGLWCLDIWAGNYGEFKMEPQSETIFVQPFKSDTLELLGTRLLIWMFMLSGNNEYSQYFWNVAFSFLCLKHSSKA